MIVQIRGGEETNSHDEHKQPSIIQNIGVLTVLVGVIMINRLILDESGATAIEYGLIAGLVAVAIIAALTALGGSLTDLFTSVSDELDGAVGS
jgi:pilus assembly protein Flp/PilA